ncbi:DUF4259 domain-containing protein [Curtobacterium luteum]|uniref:DUF4259 domain-containing protein n=1 Tax=Curtobacterium luteum TaxID=33881 RepID=UPI0038243DC3
MGTWSAEPVGNDTAADFIAELDQQTRWTRVRAAFAEALRSARPIDSDVAATAIAAAEAVAHGVGRPTQVDVYTESAQRFVDRARRPSRRLVARAVRAVEAAASPDGELAELWAEDGAGEWRVAVDRLVVNLSGARTA